MSSIEHSSREHGLLALAGTIDDGNGAASSVLRIEPSATYTSGEQLLSVLVQRALDRMIAGGCNQLVLLKLYPRTVQQAASAPQDEHSMLASDAPLEEQVPQAAWSDLHVGAVRHAIAVQMAAEAISFFGPLHGGVVTQAAFSDVIVQGRQFTTAYPHINLEHYDVYDAQTRDPVLGSWRARRIQNQRRETRTNRVIDIALLALEVSQAIFPRLVG